MFFKTCYFVSILLLFLKSVSSSNRTNIIYDTDKILFDGVEIEIEVSKMLLPQFA